VGAAGLVEISRRHGRAELGYWVGRPYWDRGYATEAARAVIEYGFFGPKTTPDLCHALLPQPGLRSGDGEVWDGA